MPAHSPPQTLQAYNDIYDSALAASWRAMAQHHHTMAQAPASSAPTFNRERHIKYHLRCIKTLLPTQYTGNDANRMMLGYFALASLELLGALDRGLKPDERAGFIEWIYSCQLPTGGFRAFPGTNFGAEKRSTQNEAWDPANLAGTGFALLNLVILGDDLRRVKRKEALVWLRKLQNEDGSFGETIAEDGRPAGPHDLRYAYIATSIRYILRGEGDGDVEDVDLRRLVEFVLSSQAHDGGIGQKPFHEPQAGYMYCGLSILSLLEKLSREGTPSNRNGAISQEFIDSTIKWLVSRQTLTPSDEESDDDEEEEAREETEVENNTGFQVISSRPQGESESATPLWIDPEQLQSAGFNGRCNKPEDTCYSFWVIGSLDVLKKANFVNIEANRYFLLAHTQHLIGGFSKVPGAPPDLLHSFFGLAALSFDGTDGLKPLATDLSISTDSRDRIQSLPWKRSR